MAQGIAVTGSPLDAFDAAPWIVRLRIELAAASQRKQRLLGICFGCQALALALGGSAGAVLLVAHHNYHFGHSSGMPGMLWPFRIRHLLAGTYTLKRKDLKGSSIDC